MEPTVKNKSTLQSQSLTLLHGECLQWQAELKSLKIDADFIRNIARRNLLLSKSYRLFKELLGKVAELNNVFRTLSVLEKEIKKEARALSLSIGQKKACDEQKYRDEMKQLQKDMAAFLESYKQVKQNILDFIRPLVLQS